MASAASESQNSYIDFATLLSPTFSAPQFANNLVTATNNPTDTSLDLSTPLSRVLFDVQEIDTRIHALTTKSALPILEHTQTQNAAAQHVLQGVEDEVRRLNESYQRLEREVLGRYAEAEEARKGAQRTWEVLRLGRAVSRVVGFARQVEGLVVESGLGVAGKEDHRGLVRATYALLAFKGLMNGDEGSELARVHVVKSLRNDVFSPSEERIKSRAQQTIREFSMSSLSGTRQGSVTFAQTEEAKARTTSAVTILYVLSSIPSKTARPAVADFQPDLLLRTLQYYLQTALTSSSASIGRSLRELPTLEKTLLEVSARCQNIVALESLLATIKPPNHPLLADAPTEDDATAESNLLQPLLHYLDTPSLPSYFWRTLASTLPPRVQDIMRAGGVSVRTLRSNRDRVRDEIRQCVLQGSQMPSGVTGRGGVQVVGNWEREAAVMVGSVTGALGR
jgi:Golgi transport complex subunit 5